MTLPLLIAKSATHDLGVLPAMANRHGCITGAKAGATSEKRSARLQRLGLPKPQWDACPVTFWDVWGEQGHPVRATVSDMGPLLLARLLKLNETQEGVLTIAFRVADDNGLLLLDLKDLRAVVQFVGDHAAQIKTGNPRLYATLLLWLLSELFENLPEVGDRDKSKLVFFFDEAHLLFSEAPPALLEKVEQVVRLIRSRGRR